MVSRLHLSDKNFNKKNSYYVNKEDDTKHIIDINYQIINTEELTDTLNLIDSEVE